MLVCPVTASASPVPAPRQTAHLVATVCTWIWINRTPARHWANARPLSATLLTRHFSVRLASLTAINAKRERTHAPNVWPTKRTLHNANTWTLLSMSAIAFQRFNALVPVELLLILLRTVVQIMGYVSLAMLLAIPVSIKAIIVHLAMVPFSSKFLIVFRKRTVKHKTGTLQTKSTMFAIIVIARV